MARGGARLGHGRLGRRGRPGLSTRAGGVGASSWGRGDAVIVHGDTWGVGEAPADGNRGVDVGGRTTPGRVALEAAGVVIGACGVALVAGLEAIGPMAGEAGRQVVERMEDHRRPIGGADVGIVALEAFRHVVLAGQDLAEARRATRGRRVAAQADLVGGHADRDLLRGGLVTGLGMLDQGAVAALAADALVGGEDQGRVLGLVARLAGARGGVRELQARPVPRVDGAVERVLEVRVPGHRRAHREDDREHRGAAQDGDCRDEPAPAGARPDGVPEAAQHASTSFTGRRG